jgi:hypothetical protein
MAAGSAAGSKASGLPRLMLVGASETTVYGMHTKSRRKEPDRIVFGVPRANLHATVTHAKDVMEYLTHPPA